MSEKDETKKEDSIEESLSSEEWTIIDEKESKLNNSPEQKRNKSELNEPKETIVPEDACKPKLSVKDEAEYVEECEEADEKEGAESDDVSVLSDESDAEQGSNEEGIVNRIERIDWQVERKPSEGVLVPKNSLDGGFASSVLITCSIAALIFGIVLAGQMANFGIGRPNLAENREMKDKLKELGGIEEKLKEIGGIEERLKELKDVKQALEQIRVNMPELQKLKEHLAYKKYEKEKYEYSVEDYKNLEKLSLLNVKDLNIEADRLGMLEAAYQNFCMTISKINSSNSMVENELCKTPKILVEMIGFKKSLKEAFEQTQATTSPDKRMFLDADKKLDSVSETLLSELSLVFTKFSMRIHERLNKFGYKLQKRLCLLSNRGDTNDEFLNILLDNEFFLNNCNETTDSIIIDSKLNGSENRKSHHKVQKRSFEESKKKEYKPHKKLKDHLKSDYSVEDYSQEKEFDDDFGAKKKGELKNDNTWKNNKYEKEVGKKLNKYEKSENQKKDQDFNSDDLSENNSKERDYHKKEYKSEKYENHSKEREYHQKEHNHEKYDNSKEKEYPQKFDRKREQIHENYGNNKFSDNNNREKEYLHKYEDSKKENNNNEKYENQRNDKLYENNSRGRDYPQKSEDRQKDFDNDFEDKKSDFRKNDNFEKKYEYRKDRKYDKSKKDYEYDNEKIRDFDRKSDSRRNYDYDTKIIIDLEDDSEEFEYNDDEKRKYNNKKEYLSRPDEYVRTNGDKRRYNNKKDHLVRSENYKESKYLKYDSSERRDKRDKNQANGEWQMQRFQKEREDTGRTDIRENDLQEPSVTTET